VSLSTPHLGVRGCVSLWQAFVGELLFPTSRQMLMQVDRQGSSRVLPLLILDNYDAFA
jgi:hypothetical protein